MHGKPTFEPRTKTSCLLHYFSPPILIGLCVTMFTVPGPCRKGSRSSRDTIKCEGCSSSVCSLCCPRRIPRAQKKRTGWASAHASYTLHPVSGTELPGHTVLVCHLSPHLMSVRTGQLRGAFSCVFSQPVFRAVGWV